MINIGEEVQAKETDVVDLAPAVFYAQVHGRGTRRQSPVARQEQAKFVL